MIFRMLTWLLIKISGKKKKVDWFVLRAMKQFNENEKKAYQPIDILPKITQEDEEYMQLRIKNMGRINGGVKDE